jgi:hypothetical protein
MASSYLVGLAFLGLGWLTACRPTTTCRLQAEQAYAGEGILISLGFSGQDGQYPLLFFPVCRLDRTAVLESLKRAGPGVLFTTNQFPLVHQAFRERALVVEDTLRTTWPFQTHEIRLLPVRIVFADPLPSSLRLQRHPYRIVSKQVQFEQQCYSTGVLKVESLLLL